MIRRQRKVCVTEECLIVRLIVPELALVRFLWILALFTLLFSLLCEEESFLLWKRRRQRKPNHHGRSLATERDRESGVYMYVCMCLCIFRDLESGLSKKKEPNYTTPSRAEQSQTEPQHARPKQARPNQAKPRHGVKRTKKQVNMFQKKMVFPALLLSLLPLPLLLVHTIAVFCCSLPALLPLLQLFWVRAAFLLFCCCFAAVFFVAAVAVAAFVAAAVAAAASTATVTVTVTCTPQWTKDSHRTTGQPQH